MIKIESICTGGADNPLIHSHRFSQQQIYKKYHWLYSKYIYTYVYHDKFMFNINQMIRLLQSATFVNV